MFHWIGAPRWAIIFLVILISASVIILAYFIVERGKEPVLTYTRSGGVAGFADKLVIYEDGEAILSSKNQVIKGKVSEEDMRALQKILEELRAIGSVEYKPKEGVADFFSYSLSYDGINISWVDPWASKEEIPGQLNSLNSLISEIIGKLRG